MLPHITRAKALERRMQLLAVSIEALNSLDVGVVLVNAPAAIVFANTAAERIFARGDGVSATAGALRATDSESDVRLQDGLRAAVAAVRSVDDPGVLHIARGRSQSPYQTTVYPLVNQPTTTLGIPTPHVMVVIVDPESPRALPTRSLESLYGLTRREAQLASTLARGVTLRQAAQKMGTTYETARSHLRRIFTKTSTSRQSTLVTLCLRLPTNTRAQP
jgi:DNA-binding CsgD family transcriptional regulator